MDVGDKVATGEITLTVVFLTGKQHVVKANPEHYTVHSLLVSIQNREGITPDMVILGIGSEKIWHGRHPHLYNEWRTFGDLGCWADTTLWGMLALRGD